MELRKYAEILSKSWILIVSVTLLGLAAGIGYSMMVTPKYQSRTQLYVSVRSEAGTSGDLAQGANYSSKIVNSYVDVIKTSVVLEPVVAKLGLPVSPSQLSSQITAAAPPQTSLINITATSTSPEQAAEIANAVGESFKDVVQNQLEASQTTKASPINITTTQVALTPVAPVSPNLPMNALLGLLAGLAIAVAVAVLRDTLDVRVNSLDDVKEVTDKPILGGIIDDPDAPKNPLFIRTKPNSPRSESLRALRTNLQFVNVNEQAAIFVMTSSNTGEGKSTTSANLALALAESGSKVALIEADLRLPMVHKYMNVEGGAGLTDVLIGQADLSDVLQRWGRTQLYFLPAGKIPPNPSELLGSHRMNKVLDSLSAEFDFIIVDAPPILSVTDAAVIGHGKTGVMVAVAAGKTKKPELVAALNSLEHAGANVVGVIVTMLPMKSVSRYGYGNYGYGPKSNNGEVEVADA